MENVKLIVEIITAIALIIYVIKTWQMASATQDAAEASKKSLDFMEQQNESEKRPFIDVMVTAKKDDDLYFIVINRGKTIAYDVHIKMNPELPESLPWEKPGGWQLSKNKIFNEGLRALPIGVKYSTLFSFAKVYLGNKENPREFVAELTYKSSWGRDYKEQIPIDLGFYDSRTYTRKSLKPIEEHIKAIFDIIKD